MRPCACLDTGELSYRINAWLRYRGSGLSVEIAKQVDAAVSQVSDQPKSTTWVGWFDLGSKAPPPISTGVNESPGRELRQATEAVGHS